MLRCTPNWKAHDPLFQTVMPESEPSGVAVYLRHCAWPCPAVARRSGGSRASLDRSWAAEQGLEMVVEE
jgi:hypothetical protein